MPWLKQLVASLSLWKPGSDLRPVFEGFVVDKVALGHVFLQVCPSSHVSVMPPMLQTHSFIYHQYSINLATDSIIK
jgi:hypothetical protein